MTCYLLVLTYDGEESYSLWKTEQSAIAERKNLINISGASMDEIEIIEVGLLD